MERIALPKGLTFSAVVCVRDVRVFHHDECTELLIDAFTRDCFGEIVEVDIHLAENSLADWLIRRKLLVDGALYVAENQLCSVVDGRIQLLYPELKPWAPDDSEEVVPVEEINMSETMESRFKKVEFIARKIANRSIRQRHYFDDDDDVRPSRRVEGVWTFGSEKYGLEKIYVYVPTQTKLPLDELSHLLSSLDLKLERAGQFKRILGVYGGKDDIHCSGTMITGRSAASVSDWRAALTMSMQDCESPSSIMFSSLNVAYNHALGAEALSRPRRQDPVVIIAPHKDICVTGRTLKALKAMHKNVSWVFYNDNNWSLETRFTPPATDVEWIPDDALVKAVRRRILDGQRVCEAFTADLDRFSEMFLLEDERQRISLKPSLEELNRLRNICLHCPVSKFFSLSNWMLRFDDDGSRMVHDLASQGLITVQICSDEVFLLEVRQDSLYLEDGRSLMEVGFVADCLIIDVAGDLCVEISGVEQSRPS
mgnify:CR=1 FL=1